MGGKIKDRSRPPPLHLLFKPALLICVVSVLYSLISSVLTGNPFDRLDVEDTMHISDVFSGSLGGHVVLCLSQDEVERSKPLNSAFIDAAGIIDDGKSETPLAKFVTVDCDAVTTKGGKSIHSKYGLDSSAKPAVVAVVNKGGKVLQVKGKDLRSGYVLSKVVRGMLEVRAGKVESTKQLVTKCLSQRYCVAILKGGGVDEAGKKGRGEFKALMEGWSDEVAFVSVDSTVLEVQGVEVRMEDFVEGKDRAVLFVNEDEGDVKDDTRVKAVGFKGKWHKDTLGKWLQEGMEGGGKDIGVKVRWNTQGLRAIARGGN
jgi:hypothetical protein